MLAFLRKATVWLTLVCFYGTTLIASAGESTWIAPAPAAADQGGWAAHATLRKNGTLQNWFDLKRGYNHVLVPRDNWTIVARAQWNREKEAFNWDMIDGPEWITKNRPEIGKMGGLPPNTIMSDWIKHQPENGRLVFAVYSPETLTLRIAVQKVEKLPNGDIIVAIMDYTPHHGRQDAYRQNYLSRAEREYDRDRLGINPYAAFAGADDDPLFHNCSWSCAVVAVGQAIMGQKAIFGWIATTDVRYDTRTSKSGSVFKKKVTTTVDAYVKPQWWFAGPVEMVPGGQYHSICVGPEAIANPNAGCTGLHRVASSGVLVDTWKGGNMPVGSEALIYQWQSTQSSWTVLFFAVITLLVVSGAGMLMAGAMGTSMGGAGIATMTGITGAPTIGSALGFGAGMGGAYAAVSTNLFTNGGLTQVQGNYLGSVTSGIATPPSNGTHSTNVAQGIQNKHILPSLDSGKSLAGVSQLFGTECPLHLSVAECNAQGKNPGMGWRTDSYMQDREVLRLRQQYRTCYNAGYRGELLAKCAAPGRPDLLQAVGY